MTQQTLTATDISAVLTRPVTLPDTLAGTSERIGALEDALTELEHGTSEFWEATSELNALRVHARMLRGMAVC
ncbi:hypothetical protein GCM10017784_35320 [Deinococcus indicus]|uniref:hypothetical protein n=1 Tax=Deinococcus indicus TaxID=223556 RepID=UPI00174EBC06|nr:hypothetical protein [Deinococcus indicus]GHG37791.1 hypothetical protein GCM10017784_35320 [Deinococcus indicus]